MNFLLIWMDGPCKNSYQYVLMNFTGPSSLSVESSLSFTQKELSLAGQEPQASPRFADLGYGS